jgi:hypothetical protein
MTDINQPSQNQPQGLIDSVPGVERKVDDQRVADVADLATRQNVVAMPVNPDRVVHISEEDFKGVPARVPGHPSNPNTIIMNSPEEESL